MMNMIINVIYVNLGIVERKQYMKNKIRPEWMNKELDNKRVDKILLTCSQFITDASIQIIYEYIKSLEKKANGKRAGNK